MPRVDVVIPCYKYAHFLRGAVESVLSQPVDVRVLIIDDGSPDNTSDVAAQLSWQDPRVQFTRHAANRGDVATYNEGLLEWAKADYSVLMSADNLLTPGSLWRSMQAMEENKHNAFVYGRTYKFRTGEVLPEPNIGPSKPLTRPGCEWIAAVCAEGGNIICSPEVMVRTRLQKELGGYRQDMAHASDLEMWLRFAAHGNVVFVDADQAYCRLTDPNMHRELAGDTITDWQYRRLAFDSIFERFGYRIPDSSTLHVRSHRRLAECAITEARAVLATNATGHCRDLLKFATETFPQSARWPSHIKTSILATASALNARRKRSDSTKYIGAKV